MKLRIHHFYDIIRDFGKGKSITPHAYGHSYHKVADTLQVQPEKSIEIVLGCDDVCTGCTFLVDSHCIDIINHRQDFSRKEKFNNYLDKRIMKICKIKPGEHYTALELCEKATPYIDRIEWIYNGNKPVHTADRKKNFIKGKKVYESKA